MHDSIQLTKTTSSRGTSISRSSRRQRGIVRLLVVAPTLAFLLLTSPTAFGGSATWNLNPIDGNWFNAANWTPATVPNGPADTATFGVSNITGVSLALCIDDIEVNGIVFDAGASAFTFTVSNFCSFTEHVIISGVGITNNSGITQSFVLPFAEEDSLIQFTNNATAGILTSFTTDQGGKNIEFHDTSTAGEATLIANSIPEINPGAVILFFGDSTGGTARVEVFGDGSLDISAHNAPGVTTGSIEGDGFVFLGANNLTLGSNGLDTIFSGVIEDSGAGGSVSKVGSDRLALTGANTYTGGTTISGGLVEVRNTVGSATGSGAVQVTRGKLGGAGIIAGPVAIGAKGGGEVVLSPGQNAGKPATLTLLNTLTFNGHGTYRVFVDSDNSTAGQVVANGVTIKNNNLFSLKDLGSGVLRSAELYDSDAGAWTPTDNLITAGAGDTATRLPDGKVLVAGGERAELYDPASGKWTRTGSLITARTGQTATLLPNGKVLIAGGNLGFGPTASAELYDPASGVWTATGDMTSARYYHTATLLPDGKVLVVGSPGVLSAEVYDPATATWARTANPITSRWSHTATLLPDGKVLVAAGSSGIGSPIALAELYDPAAGTWTATGRLIKARQVHTATLLSDGMVLVAGGQGTGITELTSAELYDPASGTWTLTGSLAVARAYHTATLLLDDQVLVVGGNNGINFMEPSAELYNPANGTWTTTGSLFPGRYFHTATLLADGQVLVTGGVGVGLQIGTVLTVIDNTATTPIAGTFSNLPEGAIVYAGHSLKASYTGGDGNDLTLTVVP